MGRSEKPILVFQTDFTYMEGAVSSMYGVVKCVDRELEIFDGTHLIPKFDTWSASYRLYQSMPFWPKGTIYVSVVDPGVGTSRRACAARTADGHVVITPDNGTLTHVARHIGILEVREIDETLNRLPSTRGTAVFHGRDLFGYTAARLASGAITWEEVGPRYPVDEIVLHDISQPEVCDGIARGIVEICDPNFGNAWTNIGWDMLEGVRESVRVCVCHGHDAVFDGEVRIGKAFGSVAVGEPVLYCNELMNAALAVFQGSFCERYGVSFGPTWAVELDWSQTTEREGITMDRRLDLYYYDPCPYCQKVLRAIRRLGIEDKIVFKNILRSQEAADTLVRVGGKRQVPCLFIDGVPMYESDDIVAWLTHTFA